MSAKWWPDAGADLSNLGALHSRDTALCSSFAFLQEQLKTELSADSVLLFLDAKESFVTDFKENTLEA